MNRKDIFFILGIILLYLTILFAIHPQIYTYRFNEYLVNDYLHSQDIPQEDIKGRVFLSDSKIHEAAGYLYATGEDPSEYNFQHPPFIKYVYGLAIILFGNPYIIQILFGITLLVGTYFFGKKLYGSSMIPAIATILLVIDPLFIDLSQNLLLDLGQTALVMMYIIAFLWHEKNWLLQGILLGLLAGSKFWGGTTLFIVGLLVLYSFITKKFRYRIMILQGTIAFGVFCLLYTKTFINNGGMFNIVFYELKTLKYWLHHSVSSFFGGSLLLFLTGYVHSWWGDKETIRVAVWTLFWPLTLFLSIVNGIRHIRKKMSVQRLVDFLPLIYLLYLGVQAPFTRYFIVILPFLYLSAVNFFTTKLISERKVR